MLCGTLTDQYFCKACNNDLPQIPEHCCTVCLRPVTIGKNNRCGQCIANPPYFTRTIAALRYAFPVDQMTHALKYQTNLTIAPVFAHKLIHKIADTPRPDLLIPMPLHPTRLKERGFNQALEISRHLSKQVRIPLILQGFKRIKATKPQASLPWKERQKNMRKAFLCHLDLTGKHVAIVDDVMTTGATLNELSKIIKQKGAVEISNWVVARVYGKDYSDHTNYPYKF